MSSLPSGWNTILAKLGFTRNKRSKQRQQHPFQRRLRMEMLEDRRVLSITVNTFVDENDNSITDGDISLRDAIVFANAGDTINFSTDPAHGLNGATINLRGKGEILLFLDQRGDGW